MTVTLDRDRGWTTRELIMLLPRWFRRIGRDVYPKFSGHPWPLLSVLLRPLRIRQGQRFLNALSDTEMRILRRYLEANSYISGRTADDEIADLLELGWIQSRYKYAMRAWSDHERKKALIFNNEGLGIMLPFGGSVLDSHLTTDFEYGERNEITEAAPFLWYYDNPRAVWRWSLQSSNGEVSSGFCTKEQLDRYNRTHRWLEECDL